MRTSILLTLVALSVLAFASLWYVGKSDVPVVHLPNKAESYEKVHAALVAGKNVVVVVDQASPGN